MQHYDVSKYLTMHCAIAAVLLLNFGSITPLMHQHQFSWLKLNYINNVSWTKISDGKN